MSSTLRSAQDILDVSNLPHIYVIAVESSSRIFEEDRCPAPIHNWIETHCPAGTAIERIKEIEDCIPVSDSAGVPETVFHVGFTDLQAAHFLRAFSEPPLAGLSEPDDIVLITFAAFDLGPTGAKLCHQSTRYC